MALSPVKGVAVRLISPFMVECNAKKGKGATVAKTTNRCITAVPWDCAGLLVFHKQFPGSTL